MQQRYPLRWQPPEQELPLPKRAIMDGDIDKKKKAI
jgi:hypothetical protein